jgi:Family of unknown function (DUF6526)
MPEQQNFQNHVRWYPLVHFVISPLLFLNLFWQIFRLYQEQSLDRAENLMLAVVLLMMSVAARLQALKAQDRVVRLEEKLRYKDILPPDLAVKTSGLRTGQMLALRFASDDELPELVRRTLNGEFKNNKEIKLAVKNWRGDYLRV